MLSFQIWDFLWELKRKPCVAVAHNILRYVDHVGEIRRLEEAAAMLPSTTPTTGKTFSWSCETAA
jgi:hypothetical protein